MTFDEAIKILGAGVFTDNVNFGDSTFVSKHEITNLDMIQIINDLRKEYAPTVEMTKSQKMLFLELFDGSDIGKDEWGQMVNGEYPELPELSYKESIITYLHPETIKVIGENND